MPDATEQSPLEGEGAATEEDSSAPLDADSLSHVFHSLPVPSLGAVSRVSHRWQEALSLPVWRHAAQELWYTWGMDVASAEALACSCGGWKHLVKRDHHLEHRWRRKSSLRVRHLEAGEHWVPAIIMEERSRQLVTCSYDGTIRFWTSLDNPQPRCFHRVTSGLGEGFSCIAALPQADGSVLLAAGSDFGNVHVWEAWLPDADVPALSAVHGEADDADDDDDDGEEDEATHEVYQSGSGPAAAPAAPAAPDSVDNGTAGEASRLRSPFSRQRTSWHNAHDFVQSILALPCGRVVSGGDAGLVRVHRVCVEEGHATRNRAGTDEDGPSHALATLSGHSGAVMCLGSAPGGQAGTVFSGSVDHTIGRWDIHAGVLTARLGAEAGGHSRSVHCLTVAHATPLGEQALFTGSRDHTIRIWDMRSNACEHALVGHVGSVTCIDADGWRLASGGGYNRGADDEEILSVDSSLRLWDLRKLGGAAPNRHASAAASAASVATINSRDLAPVVAEEGGLSSSRPHASGSCLVWAREAPSPAELHNPFATPGDPVLSLSLHADRVLTSHGGTRWTARIWDLVDPGPGMGYNMGSAHDDDLLHEHESVDGADGDGTVSIS
jgi:WD40 repeat protein